MRFKGGVSWEVRWGRELEVDTALYIRDALALAVEPDQWLPPVEPAVPVSVPPGVDRAGVQREWPAWWAEVLEFSRFQRDVEPARLLGARPSQALVEGSALHTAIAAFTVPAARHSDTAHPPRLSMNITDLVREFEGIRGRRANPFKLVVTEVSVAGHVWHRLADDHVLVSVRFADDEGVFGTALRRLLRELV
jgi:hypothetical protein